MKKHKSSYDDIASLNPCWLRDGRAQELRSRVGSGVTATQIAEATDITAADRRWLLVRLAARLPEGRKLLVLWAAGCAQDVRHLVSDEYRDDADVAIQTAVAWTEGAATPQDCRAAAAAAYAAAAYAAAYATYAAAYAATAAEEAAEAAAEAAAELRERHLQQLAVAIEAAHAG